jgi:hypothetical protein
MKVSIMGNLQDWSQREKVFFSRYLPFRSIRNDCRAKLFDYLTFQSIRNDCRAKLFRINFVEKAKTSTGTSLDVVIM